MVGQPQRLINIVGHQDYRAPQNAVNAGHLRLQRAARHRIQRAKGFIHQQHLRVGRQRPRHANPLLLPAGKLMRIAVAQLALTPAAPSAHPHAH
jgi:hypothetical protein